MYNQSPEWFVWLFHGLELSVNDFDANSKNFDEQLMHHKIFQDFLRFQITQGVTALSIPGWIEFNLHLQNYTQEL